MRIITHCIAYNHQTDNSLQLSWLKKRTCKLSELKRHVDAIIRGAALHQVRRIDLTFNSANVNGNWRTHYRLL